MDYKDTERIIKTLVTNEWFPYWEGWDESLVREFIDYIDWGVLFNYPTYSEDFVREVLQHCQPNDWEEWMQRVSYKKKNGTTILMTVDV